MMRFLFITFFLASFVSMSIFGFLGMDHLGEQGHNNGGCIASTVLNTDCLKMNLLDSAIFHLNASKVFSTAVFNESALNIFLIIAVLFFFFWSKVKLIFSPKLLQQNSLGHIPRDVSLKPRRQKIAHWLTLHENSPATL